MIKRISAGNMNPGSHTNAFDGIIEFRTEKGARLYTQVKGNIVTIIGYSSKRNQDAVIALLKREKLMR
ncbi:MAG: hypothetical protein LBV67_03080 [Streptococcaceae bacterium]|nr:hypothetical protein [Streptococcaceae bacterium]